VDRSSSEAACLAPVAFGGPHDSLRLVGVGFRLAKLFGEWSTSRRRTRQLPSRIGDRPRAFGPFGVPLLDGDVDSLGFVDGFGADGGKPTGDRATGRDAWLHLLLVVQEVSALNGGGEVEVPQLVVTTHELIDGRRQIVRGRIQGSERRKLVGKAVGDELEDRRVLVDIAQAVPSEISQLDMTAHQRLGGIRHDDLSPMGHSVEPSDPIQRRPEVVAVALVGLAGVDPHPDRQCHALGPRFTAQTALRCDR
jgi:hypothetical protein